MERNDRKRRSATKSIIWRMVGVFVLAAVTYFYTKNWVTVGLITLLHHGVFLIIYYLNERFFEHVDYTGLKRSIIKCICYETILGTFVLGVITLIVTGDVQQITRITLTYIGIKHVIYVFNEFIWNKISWGKR